MSPIPPVASVDSQISVDADSLVAWEEVIDSPSFPSLTTQYKMHQLTAVVSGLPSTSFTTSEGSEPETGKVHFWEWRQDSPDV